MASFYKESIYPSNPLKVRLISSSHIQNKHGETRLAAKLGRYYAMPGQMPVKGGVALSQSGRGGRMFERWTYKEVLEKYQSGYLVIVFLGDNDARSMDENRNHTTLKAWNDGIREFGNLVKGIEFEKSEHGWIVLLGVSPMIHEFRAYVTSAVSKINLAMSDLARAVPDRVGYVDMNRQPWNKIDLFREDKVHLSEKGEDEVFGVITKIISVVGRLRGSDITLADLELFNKG